MLYNISDLGSICGKNPYEPRERTLLNYLAKINPKLCKNILIDNNVITIDNRDYLEDRYLVLNALVRTEVNKVNVDRKNISEDFVNTIIDNISQKYKNEEPNSSPERLKLMETLTRNQLNKKIGSVNESRVVKAQGGSRPKKNVQYKIDDNITIKGVCDCVIEGEMIIEIKNRTRPENVRKNEYDLYQVMGYMLAYGINKAKIVQQYNGTIYTSNDETEVQFGIISLENEYYANKLIQMIREIKRFNNQLYKILTEEVNENTFPTDFFNKAFILEDLPICVLNNNHKINQNNKYQKLLNLI